jgi:hypothetical protein
MKENDCELINRNEKNKMKYTTHLHDFAKVVLALNGDGLWVWTEHVGTVGALVAAAGHRHRDEQIRYAGIVLQLADQRETQTVGLE